MRVNGGPGDGARGGAADRQRSMMRAVNGALRERAKKVIVLRSGGCCARVAVVDPRGLREALKACDRSQIVASDEGSICASLAQSFDEAGLGLRIVRRLAREVPGGGHRVCVVCVVVAAARRARRAREDPVGDSFGYDKIDPAHTPSVSRDSDSASASCASRHSNSARS
jgi:hypothetical protein